ncbi:DNA -binding domain-containing protein [Alcaligenes faecalis]|uniref:DNA -binding domain-containing protein n=1 Tax=Alcaligenes faecalis TaxID=511 RepID=UPI00122CE4FA|nr:DUF2285 domain-containing protein [Alcaligenes faecalis]KAA1288935.1 DUF2285 domain-containing protein [Alcaligenes faecalis]MCR4142916.1 DUF2285 domain-containing protein [Alcaligenes faecalis]WHQ43781.1 DUF2285 domain-containing protein [Alcaligenes faecalis]
MAQAQSADAWQLTARYLYLLHLDGPALAWEYLRRNPDYQTDYAAHAQRQQHASPNPLRWGLIAWEDPRGDARDAFVLWHSDCLPAPFISHGFEAAMQFPQQLDLWALPGRKRLRALPGGDAHLALLAQGEAYWLRARIAPTALAAANCHLWLPVAGASAQPWLPYLQTSAQVRRSVSRHGGQRTRKYRAETLHMRALQALDGIATGASQRELAEVIFGCSRSRDVWHGDSGLRSQVRNYVNRGNFFMRGAYRELLALC